MPKNPLRILAGQPLRRQVIGATCALLIPFAAIELWSESRTRLERAEEAQAQAASVAATAASYLNQYLNGRDSMASALVQHPAVIGLDRAQSDRLFAEVLRHQPLLLNIVLTDSAGRLHGSGMPAAERGMKMNYPGQVASMDAPMISPLDSGVK